MKKIFIMLGISSLLLIGCGDVDTNETDITEEAEQNISNTSTEVVEEDLESSQNFEEVEEVNELSLSQRRNITEVASDLDDSLTYYQANYIEEFHAIIVLIDDHVILDEYLRAIEGEPAYVDAFQSTGNTLQETSRKIVRDSGVDDLALIFAAPLEDNNAAIIFRFENGVRITDVFEELGYY